MAEHVASSHPKWFTPLRLLLIFCFTNLFVYLDRGLVASNGVNGSPRTERNPQGSGIQGEFGLTYFQDGLLATFFLVGLLISSPIFAESCKQYSGFRLLGIGMGVWCLGVLACGVAPTYGLLLAARAVVGVGEASFVALAAPFIDDYAPAAVKASWFAAFYLCIPVGFALGYIVGGLVAPALGWRWAFILEALPLLPFVAFCLTAQPLHMHGMKDTKAATHGSEGGGSSGPGHKDGAGPKRSWAVYLRHFGADVYQVVSQRVWLLACSGYTLYVAVLGVYAFWGPKAGAALYFEGDSKAETADLVFGGVTVLTGVLGSVGGGVLLDRLGSTLRMASVICGCACLLGLVALLPAFLSTTTFAGFMSAFAVGQLLIFLLQAPVVAVQMWSVPTSLRPLGASLTTLSIHLLGDVPSPPLLGMLQSKLAEGKSPHDAAQQWRISLSVISLLLVGAGILFLLAAKAAVPARDYKQKASDDSSDQDPLLQSPGGSTYDEEDAPGVGDPRRGLGPS